MFSIAVMHQSIVQVVTGERLSFGSVNKVLTASSCSLQDAQAGRNVIDCLLRYLDKGRYWTDSSDLRTVAIGIMRKVTKLHMRTQGSIACQITALLIQCVSKAVDEKHFAIRK